MRWVSVWARGEGGPPGRWEGEQPVSRERFGIRRCRLEISEVSCFRRRHSFSSSVVVFCSCSAVVSLSVSRFRRIVSQSATSSTFSISPRIPHTTAVSPHRTTALPCECVREPVWTVGGLDSECSRPEGRRRPRGEVRFAVR